jgi:hypothetical protein
MLSYKFLMENKNNDNLRNPFLRSDVISRSKTRTQSFNAQYNDSPPLDENVLKDMAQAYAEVLSKYGYSVKPNSESAIHNSQDEFANSNKIEGQANRVPPIETPFYNSNLDYLSNNLLTSPNNNLNQASLQEANNLLMQILNELKTIVCLIEVNRRRRLS